MSKIVNLAELINLPSANVIVGNASGIATPVALTGDVSITNTGVTGARWNGQIYGGTYTTGTIASMLVYNSTSSDWRLVSSIPTTLSSTITSVGTLASGSIPYSLLTGTPSLTGYVPYTGATGAVNLGTNTLASGAITSSGVVQGVGLNFGSSSFINGYNNTQHFAVSTNGTNRLFTGGTYLTVSNQANTNDILFLTDAGALTLGTAAGTGTGALYSGAITSSADFTMTGVAGTTRYFLTNETGTGTGKLVMQAGGGSIGFGGSISLFAHANATKAGWVVAGISSGSGGKFSVQNAAIGTGTDVFTVDVSGNTVALGTLGVTGAATFSGSVTMGSNTLAANLPLTINTASGFAQRINFQIAGADQWLLGNGAASQNTNFELYNASGTIALSFVKATNAATFSNTIQASSYKSLKNGNASISSQFELGSATSTVYGANLQLGATGSLDFYTYDVASLGWGKYLSIAATGPATFSAVITGQNGIQNTSTSQALITYGGLWLGTPLTVATLPSISTGTSIGIYYVTDALAPTWGATVVGGGAVKTLVMWDGTAWKVH
jgi:hypothetical protein